jgi:hydroxymethylbilane synthase
MLVLPFFYHLLLLLGLEMLSGLRIGSRRSELARLQSKMVGAAVGSSKYVFREAPGDTNLKDPLWKMPEMGIFTSFLRKYLVTKEIDLVVHSWKDLPIEPDVATEIVAALPRADPRDLILVSKSGLENAYTTGVLTVLSSSPRRKHNLPEFLLRSIPQNGGRKIESVRFVDVRGNIQTRLSKLMNGTDGGQALVVAKAAIDRFLEVGRIDEEFKHVEELIRDCLSQSYWQVLPLSLNPTAAAQGALAVEMLADHELKGEVNATLNDKSTYACVDEERRILHGLGGGCHQKIGCTVLDRPFGKVTFLRGVSDKLGGKDIMRADIRMDENAIRTASRDSIGQIGGKSGLQLFDRSPIDDAGNTVKKMFRQHPRHGVFVAKSDAAPNDIIDQLTHRPVWTSGVSSWFVLARKGVWVNGTCDGLGETEPKQIQLISGCNEWIKLTHTGATGKDPTAIGTYELVPKKNCTAEFVRSEISGKSHLFFSSGSSFERLIELCPEILDSVQTGGIVVGCGPGNTYDRIRDIVGSKTRVVVAYNHEDFQNLVSGERI